MCAIEAGKRGRRIAVLEHRERAGSKILISGGGRCNFTNLHCSPRNFLSANPHFCKSALARYTPADFVKLVVQHGIAYHEKTLGQLFCDWSAGQIVNMLLSECRAAGVQVITNCSVSGVTHDGRFSVDTSLGAMSAGSVVVASGGLSIPRMGATDLGYRIARHFGIAIQECRPALVPLVLARDGQARFCDLSGISADVVASFQKTRFREKLLIAHQGLSGPAILQLSSYWSAGQQIAIDWTPDHDPATQLLRRKHNREKVMLKNVITEWLPRRLAERFATSDKSLQEFKDVELQATAAQLKQSTLTPAGTEGYAKAEVTAGGVDTRELSSQTMECQRVPGLYFIGEVVDVTGHLGGFNFQWAWASGWCAGQAL